jgi:GNAT superfamily N-acetyltransferase
MLVRPRRDEDLDRCVAMATVVHREDHYPFFLSTDLRSFLAVPDALGAWVVERGDDIVGHAALHPTTAKAVMALAIDATGLGPDDFGIVSRLVVSAGARGTGAAQQLLEAATAQAYALGRQPMLDVDVRTEAAIRLYERNGWRRLGQVASRFPGGTLEEYVYLGPERE